MHSFQRTGGVLHCEEVSLAELAGRHGTPLYVYSRATLTRHYRVFDEGFGDFPHLICFAVKANSNLGLLGVLARLGAGADVVSGGELHLAQRAGIDPARIVYSGVGKKREEMEQALRAGILSFNIESFQELAVLDETAGRLGARARISLRVNPGIDPQTHPYVATGQGESKFGIGFAEALEGYRSAAALPNIEVAGVDCHIGSQLTELAPFIESARRLRQLVEALRGEGLAIRFLDVGGGLGITYHAEQPPLPREYAAAIRAELAGLNVTLILEPGRNLAGNAGVLLTRVLYLKESGAKKFIIVDAGMNDLIRPSLYQAYHEILPVEQHGRARETADVVGPICESGDFLAKDRELERPEPGELLAVMSAGAYGSSMASTYNSRPRAAEVLVDGGRVHLIRERQTYDDLLRGQHLVD